MGLQPGQRAGGLQATSNPEEKKPQPQEQNPSWHVFLLLLETLA